MRQLLRHFFGGRVDTGVQKTGAGVEGWQQNPPHYKNAQDPFKDYINSVYTQFRNFESRLSVQDRILGYILGALIEIMRFHDKTLVDIEYKSIRSQLDRVNEYIESLRNNDQRLSDDAGYSALQKDMILAILYSLQYILISISTKNDSQQYTNGDAQEPLDKQNDEESLLSEHIVQQRREKAGIYSLINYIFRSGHPIKHMFFDLPIAIVRLVKSSLRHPASPFFYGAVGSILAIPWLPSFYTPVAVAATMIAIFAHKKLTGEGFREAMHNYFVEGQINQRVNFFLNAFFAFPTLEVLYKTFINPGVFVTYNHVIKNLQERINFGIQAINKPEQILPLNIESLLNTIGSLAVGAWNNIGDFIFKHVPGILVYNFDTLVSIVRAISPWH